MILSQPLSQEQIKYLKNEWLQRHSQHRVAPSLLGVLGLAVNMLSTLLLVWHCPAATERAPLWVYLTCAAALFFSHELQVKEHDKYWYSALGTPLGAFVDRGCEALSAVFVLLGACVSAQLGARPNHMFLCCFAAMTMFYLDHWQTYVRNGRHLIMGLTEVRMYVIVMHLAAALPDPLPSVPVKMVAPSLIVVCSSVCVGYLWDNKNHYNIAGKSVRPFLHITLVLLSAASVRWMSPSRLFERHPCLYVLAFGCVSVKVTSKLIVAHITRSEMHMLDWTFLGPGLLLLNQLFHTSLDEHLVLWVALVLSVLDLLRYGVSVCTQIAAHLDIYVFTLKPPASPVSSSSPGCHKWRRKNRNLICVTF